MQKLLDDFDNLSKYDQIEFLYISSLKNSISKSLSKHLSIKSLPIKSKYKLLINNYETCLENYLNKVTNGLYHDSLYGTDSYYRKIINNRLTTNVNCTNDINKALFIIYNFISEDEQIINYKINNKTICEHLIEFFINHDVNYCLNFETIDYYSGDDDILKNHFYDKSLYTIVQLILNSTYFDWIEYTYIQSKYDILYLDELIKLINSKSIINLNDKKYDDLDDYSYDIIELDSEYYETIDFKNEFEIKYYDHSEYKIIKQSVINDDDDDNDEEY